MAQLISDELKKILDQYGGGQDIAARKAELAKAAATAAGGYDQYIAGLQGAGATADPYFLEAMKMYGDQRNQNIETLNTGLNSSLNAQAQATIAAQKANLDALNRQTAALDAAYNQAVQAGNEGVARALEAQKGSLQQAIAAAQHQYDLNMANVQRSIDMDRRTLEGYLAQGMQAVSPYVKASQKQLGVLDQLIGSLTGEGAGLPTSLGAQLAMQDSTRQVHNAMQRQGLAGSGMEAAANASLRSRVLAQDQTDQMRRAQDMVNSGMQGAGLESALLSNFGQQIGQLGGRLGTVQAPDTANLYMSSGNNAANIYAQLATTLANLAQNRGTSLSNAYGNYGTNQANLAQNRGANQAAAYQNFAQNVANMPNMLPQMTQQYGANKGTLAAELAAQQFAKTQQQAQFQSQMAQMQPNSQLSQLGEWAKILQSGMLQMPGVNSSALLPQSTMQQQQAYRPATWMRSNQSLPYTAFLGL